MAPRELIEADFAEATCQYGRAVQHLYLGDDGDDSVCLELGGTSYTLFLAEAYPEGACQVFGDREFELLGTISEMIAQLLQQHASKRAAQGCEGLEAAVSSSCSCSSDDLEEPNDLIDAACSQEFTLEYDARFAEFDADVLAAKETYGKQAVEASVTGDSCRLLLRFDPSVDGALDRITAGAWGIDLKQPICVRLFFNAEDDAAAVIPSLRVYQGENHSESSFEAEKQLTTILADFFRERSRRTPGILSKERPGKRLRPEAEGGHLEMLQSEAVDKPDTGCSEADARIAKLQRKKAQVTDDVLKRGGSVVTQLLRFLPQRLLTLHEYCAICDEPHTQPPMLQRTVCSRQLCCWQFGQFGSLISDAAGLNSSTEVMDLLVCMAIVAAKSKRKQLIFDPFPTLFAQDMSTPLLSSSTDNCFQQLEQVMKRVEAARSSAPASAGAQWLNDTSALAKHGETVRPMVQWLGRSTRCVLVPLPTENMIPELGTEWQYLLVSAPPEREARFQELKSQYGSDFAFHGSAAENWHSIVRNGLKNASHTHFMAHGAAHGSGIYLSPDSTVSERYCYDSGSGPGGSTPFPTNRTVPTDGMVTTPKTVSVDFKQDLLSSTSSTASTAASSLTPSEPPSTCSTTATASATASASASTLSAGASFCPARHLVQPPANLKTYSVQDVGYDSEICDFGMSEPFRLLSDEALQIIREQVLENREVLENCTYSSRIAPKVLRDVAGHSSFVEELWSSQEMTELISGVANFPLKPHPMRMERAHINIQELHLKKKQKATAESEPTPVFGWHKDSQPFVCIVMLSDMPEDAQGGETYVKVRRVPTSPTPSPTPSTSPSYTSSTTPNAETQAEAQGEQIIKLQFPAAGFAYVLQGSVITHAAMPAQNFERITMITSYVPRDSSLCLKTDRTNLALSRTYSNPAALQADFTHYRLKELHEYLGQVLYGSGSNAEENETGGCLSRSSSAGNEKFPPASVSDASDMSAGLGLGKKGSSNKCNDLEEQRRMQRSVKEAELILRYIAETRKELETPSGEWTSPAAAGA